MATHSTKAELEVGDIFDCPICLEKLNVPKYLPCLHTYCETCIKSYIESTAAYTDQTEKSEFTIDCPVCRKRVSCNDKNVKIENWAKNLPLNHLILSLIDSSKQSSDSAGVGIKTCSCCERNNESAEAKFWCKQCPDFLCEPCKIFHGKSRQSMAHEVLCLEDVKDFGSIPEEEPCPMHKGKVFEVYCKDHKKLCCSVCFATQHRTCSSVLSIDDACQEPGVTSGAEIFVGHLSKFAFLVAEAIKVKQDNILAIESEQKTFLDDMSKKINDIKQLLDKLYQMVRTSVSGVCDEQLGKLRSTEEQLKGFKATLTGDEKLLQAVIQHGNTKQMFLTCEKLKVQILEHFKQLQPVIQADEEVHLKFSEHSVLQSLLDLQTLADVDVVKSVIKCNADIKAASKEMDTWGYFLGEELSPCVGLSLPDMWTNTDLVVEHITTINPKDPGESKTKIYGGTFSDDGKLILVDGENKKVKVYDSYGNHEVSYDLQCTPYDVTSGGKFREIYITHDNNNGMNCVSKCTLKEQLTINKTMEVPSNATEISFAGDALVLGTRDDIYIVCSTTGSILHQLPINDGDYDHATAVYKSDRFVHTDGSCIVCRNLQMGEIFKYDVGCDAEPRGITFDQEGNIYVCDKKAEKIVKIRSDGSEGKVFLSKFRKIEVPWRMRFHPNGKTFFVIDDDNRYVEIYNIQRKME